MKVLYYDTFSGISGDMHLGAMIDLGVDANYLIEELKKLGLSHEYEIKVKEDARKGITGTKVDVVLLNQPHEHSHTHEEGHSHHSHEHLTEEVHDHCHEEEHHHIHSEVAHLHGHEVKEHIHNHNEDTHLHNHHHSHSDEGQEQGDGHTHHHGDAEHTHNHHDNEHSHHDHDHEGEGHTHGHNHSHEGGHSHDHEHRNLYIIEELINKSELNENVKKLSIDIFKQVAEAEAKVHGKPIYEVHFHEVGATDSIVDIVGAAICLDYLKVDKILGSPIEVGGGFVKCAHGLMPVPAPATSEILKGVPITKGAVPFETTTPTGAAILKVAVDKFTKEIDFIINKVAYGVGNRDTDIPNVLRVYLGHYEKASGSSDFEQEREIITECNIDDMNSETYEYVLEKLFKAGAKDVYITPIIMKKGRPAQKLTVLAPHKIQGEVEEILLRDTTTFGVRKYEVEKVMLKRDFIKVNTKYGEATVKRGILKGEVIKFKGEYDCCKELAKKNNVTLEEVYNEIKKNM
ncbi:uncharacterized protein (TIGR00299 family) protein [Clostridium punense]|uniref:Pyridinium-3,5-bisthiocarboxylic acid mononucleotide nickel insertion protein n=1 Tax=Clostridium punense TaxID=1054297 RepID=A0ABS4K018_9CLOT|nr:MULTISPECIES: nickel pincer cofactor biosynthesis protein LarC [Clostridium]EQB89119.1 hypothetical protein M918_21840 [Clostridium sp. BL8]MBP2021129.1 uncharacterized protein (TIGR00299 family) protein [Clostridium punense]